MTQPTKSCPHPLRPLAILAAMLLLGFPVITLLGRVRPAPAFSEGDAVVSIPGHIRGVVIKTWCPTLGDSCAYDVRFPTATMEPQTMAAYELAKAAP